MIELNIALLGTALSTLAIAFAGLYKVVNLLYQIEKRLSKLEYGREMESQRLNFEAATLKGRVEDLEQYLEQRSGFEYRGRDN